MKKPNKEKRKNPYVYKGITIDGKIAAIVEKFAKQEKRSFSNAVEVLLESALKDQEKETV